MRIAATLALSALNMAIHGMVDWPHCFLILAEIPFLHCQ